MVRVVRLVLKLLGGFQAQVEGGEPVEVPGRKAQALLAFLASPPGVEHARDELAALLWPDMPAAQARANLRLNLFGLRRALAFADCLRLERDTVVLDATRVDVDTVAFERALARGGPDDGNTSIGNVTQVSTKVRQVQHTVCGCAIAEGRALYARTASSARASWRSAVSKPSVNQP